MKAMGLLAIFAFANVASATPAALLGPGAMPCARFAKEYGADPDRTEALYAVWAWGYMSGRNSELLRAHVPTRDLSAVDDKELLIAARLYCIANPLMPFVIAIDQEFEKLNLVPR